MSSDCERPSCRCLAACLVATAGAIASPAAAQESNLADLIAGNQRNPGQLRKLLAAPQNQERWGTYRLDEARQLAGVALRAFVRDPASVIWSGRSGWTVTSKAIQVDGMEARVRYSKDDPSRIEHVGVLMTTPDGSVGHYFRGADLSQVWTTANQKVGDLRATIQSRNGKWTHTSVSHCQDLGHLDERITRVTHRSNGSYSVYAERPSGLDERFYGVNGQLLGTLRRPVGDSCGMFHPIKFRRPGQSWRILPSRKR